MKYCPNCGSELRAEAKFCPTCGYNLELEDSLDADHATEPFVANTLDTFKLELEKEEGLNITRAEIKK